MEVPRASAAERVRSILAAAVSFDLLAGDRRSRLNGRHTVDAEGDLIVQLPADSGLVAALAGGVDASAEFTDVAPVALRNRVRAQFTLGGRLHALGRRTGDGTDPAGTVIARLDPACVQLIEGARFTLVNVAGYGWPPWPGAVAGRRGRAPWPGTMIGTSSRKLWP
jgi:hypothetical protein